MNNNKITQYELITRELNSVKGNAGCLVIDFVKSKLENPTYENIIRYICTMGASEIIDAICKGKN